MARYCKHGNNNIILDCQIAVDIKFGVCKLCFSI